MGERHTFEKEMLIVGMLSKELSAKEAVKISLEKLYGASRYAGPTIPFTYTDYYTEEMGPGLERDFLVFDTLIDPSQLAEIKIRCNGIENEHLDPKTLGRTVNLDPGTLSLGKLILASTKNHAHRIPLYDGIYGEVTLIYREKSYRSLPWTYPDYKSKEYLDIFHRLRKDLKTYKK